MGHRSVCRRRSALPQNFQLIDLSGQKLQLLYDMPLPLGEPHYAQMIKADKIKAIDVYKPVGLDPVSGQVDRNATVGGKERIERKQDGVHVFATAVRSHFTPDIVRVKKARRFTSHHQRRASERRHARFCDR